MSLPLNRAWALDGSEALRLSTVNGWQAFEIITQGDDISAISDPDYGATALRGKYDGIGALLYDNKLVIDFNHEISSDGAVTRVETDIVQFKQAVGSLLNGGLTSFPASFAVGSGYAYDKIYTAAYHAVNNPLPIAEGTQGVADYGNLYFGRFCSGTAYVPGAFGTNRGFVDPLYLTGVEDFDGQGQFFALDQVNREFWEVPDVGKTSWENAAQVDTGDTTHVAMVMNADIAGAPIRLYVGEKNIDVNEDGSIDLLERNGLRGGTIYYFQPDPGFSTTDLPDGQVTGKWGDGLAGALTENKLEDIHTNPANGAQLVFADQTDGVYTIDLNLQFLGNDFDQTSSTATITQIDPSGREPNGIGAPDNVVWSANGKIYVQEDGDDIWQIDPDGTGLTQIAHVFSEPSGIVDVSLLVGYEAGSVLLTSIQGDGSANAQLCVLVAPTAAPLADTADFNDDGVIDGRDFLIWQRQVDQGARISFPLGDANHDARVDANDLTIWQTQYGTTPNSLSIVPEPTGLMLGCSILTLLHAFSGRQLA